MKIFLVLIIAVVILIASLALSKPFIAAAKVLLLVTQEFPQIPFKPLHRITSKPLVERVQFGRQKIVGDLFIPKNSNQKPALIVAMGVKTSEKDKPILLGFCESLARLGYVVLWPRLADLENETVKFEDPNTFIQAFYYLEKRNEVNSQRISFVGFSVGSSIAMVAAEDSGINQKLRSLVFFGGYYNLLDYLHSLFSKTMIINSISIAWQASKEGVNHANGILEKEGLKLEQFKKVEQIPESQKNALLRFSPHQKIKNYKAPIFIMHEKSDTFVPYVESEKLKRELEGRIPLVYHQANLFEHVQPKKGLSIQLIKEFAGLFLFLHKVFMYI